MQIQVLKGDDHAENQIFHEPAQWKAMKAL